MALPFGSIVVFDTSAKDLIFEDGTEVHVPANILVFRKPRAIEINRAPANAGSFGGDPLTDILRFTPSIDLRGQTFSVKLPLVVEPDEGTPVILRDNPNYPEETDCLPNPGVTVSLATTGFATFDTTCMYTMQVIKDPDA